jgi:hypothetical protein
MENSIVNKFVMFALNFPQNWVEQCFKDKIDNHLVNHLKIKWMTAYERGGSAGAMIYFYSSLDRNNQSIIDNYLKEYRG